MGDHYVLSTTQQANALPALLATYHAALRELGRELKKPLLNRIVCTVANKRRKAQALKFFGDVFLAAYSHWGHDNVTAMDTAERDYDGLNRQLFIIGEASECIERIQAYEEIGIGHIACLMNFGGAQRDMADESLRLFGEKVLPAFA